CGMVGGMLACGDGSPSLACNTCSANGSAVTCDRPVPTAYRCGMLGPSLTCTVTGGAASCREPHPPPGTEGVTCNGNMLQRCSNGGLAMLDCGASNMVCSTAGNGGCVSATPYPGCADGTFAEMCAGTKPLFCGGGALHVTDCAFLGFTG